MRLLVVVHPYPPVPSVGANRWGAMVKYLRRLGHEVGVVTTGAFGPTPGEQDVIRTTDLMALGWLRRLFGLAPLARPGVATQAAPPPGVLMRTVVPDAFLLSWAPMAWRAARGAAARHDYDCVITSAPAESTHFVGLALARRGLPWIADFRDGWTFEPYRPPFPTGLQRRLDSRLESAVVRRADGLIAATRPIAEDFRRRFGVEAEHVPNGWDPDLERDLPAAGEENGGGSFTLVHTGNMTGMSDRRPEALFAGLARALAGDPALRGRLRLLLAGPQDERVDAVVAEHRLGDVVEHLGRLSRPEAIALQRRADALVLVTSKNTGEASGKLTEYLVAGRPIIALASGNEAARVITETGTGVALDSDDLDAVAGAIAAAASGELAYEPHGTERYVQPAPAEALLDVVERAIARRR